MPRRRLTGKMSPEEKELVVVALDHDARQPQHSVEMGLRALRLIAADLEARRFLETGFDGLILRMKAELASIGASIRQVIDTQQDLIDAIRLEFDDTRPSLRPIRAEELIERVRRSNRGLAGDIELRAAGSRLMFVSDERWVERILNNLLINAIWHSDGGKILLAARPRGGDIVFEVRDNGRGMSPDKVVRVFEPIKAPSLSAIGQPVARSGLGLYNVRLFTERLGGYVDCVSAPNRGTLFRVRLPGPIDRVNRISKPRHTGAAEAVRNKLVAILDDDLGVLRSTERALVALGIEVYADHDPLRWLNVVTDLKRVPDLILLDFQLRGDNCSLQLDIVRQKWREESPKILVISGDGRGEELAKVSSTVPVLLKPLCERKFDFILEVLSGHRELPESGFV